MSADPRLEPECRKCEDWGTVVLFDDRDMPKALRFCGCAKGREEEAKDAARKALAGAPLRPEIVDMLTELCEGVHVLDGEDLYARGDH